MRTKRKVTRRQKEKEGNALTGRDEKREEAKAKSREITTKEDEEEGGKEGGRRGGPRKRKRGKECEEHGLF